MAISKKRGTEAFLLIAIPVVFRTPQNTHAAVAERSIRGIIEKVR